jgi:hypothetical protein
MTVIWLNQLLSFTRTQLMGLSRIAKRVITASSANGVKIEAKLADVFIISNILRNWE